MHKSLKKYSLVVVSALTIFMITGCASGGRTLGRNNSASDNDILVEPVPKLLGLKHTIAVGKFDAIGAFTAKHGEWDIGGGLSAMLTTALVESDQFIVVERANVKQILLELELKADKVAHPDSGPDLGKLTGASLMIYGSVTEFTVDSRGGGVSIGGAGGAKDFGASKVTGNAVFSAGASSQSSFASVAMDIRIVDMTTGQVLQTYVVEEDIENKGFDITIGYGGLSLGMNRFWKTPLGQATRKAINKAVKLIVVEAQKKPWIGRVVEVFDNEVYINAGSHSGIRKNSKFLVERIIKTFTDPVTGNVLGSKKKKLGVVEITNVEEKLAYGALQPLGSEIPKRGDLVIITNCDRSFYLTGGDDCSKSSQNKTKLIFDSRKLNK